MNVEVRHVRSVGGHASFDVFLVDDDGARHLRGTVVGLGADEERAMAAALGHGELAIYGAGATTAQGAALDTQFGYGTPAAS